MSVKNSQYKGIQKVIYTNNLPDTLAMVSLHLYFNAFQSNSEMDANLQTLPDPDGRMATSIGAPQHPMYESRIARLTPGEIDYLRVKKLTQDGVPATISHKSTILKVTLPTPILPHSFTILGLNSEGQMPVMIRRARCNGPDGAALSMAQWYPKIVAYNHKGWHTTEYLGRELCDVWGSFDVKITLDKTCLVGALGILQNPNGIGFGYENKGVEVPTSKSSTKIWHFTAEHVHDFTWAADP